MKTAAAEILLPRADGTLRPYRPAEPRAYPRPARPLRSRVFLAAAHVVCDPFADTDPVLAGRLDWEATLAYRRHLWSFGLGVAEAMDTAQRGGALGWPAALELIRRSAAEARAVGGAIVAGVSTDQLESAGPFGLDAIEAAFREQCELVQAAGARVAVMPSRQLATSARGPADYTNVYGHLLGDVTEPVILHWLGPAFDPALATYWGSVDTEQAGESLLALIADHPSKVDGVKLSLLDPEFEERFRVRLPEGVRLYTGDDFDYPSLIKGDGSRHSDALLGAFDAVAPAASAALAALDEGDGTAYDEIMASTLPLARHVFAAPTRHYKVGVVFLAYVNGHQSHFRMLGGLEGARSAVHLSELFVRAGDAGLLVDPELASERMARVLALAGIA